MVRAHLNALSLPFSRTGMPPVPVKDLTSGPDVPDLELVWLPLTVFEESFSKPPSDSSGVTMVRQHAFQDSKIASLTQTAS